MKKHLIPLFLFGLFLPQLVFASAAGIGIMPSITESGEARNIFTYNLDPGAHIEDSVRVINPGTEAQGLAIFAVDATMSDGGGFALKDITEDQNSVGSWITLDSDLLTVEPNSESEVKFTIDVPKTASPGDYAGGVLISSDYSQNVNADAEAAPTTGITAVIRVGVRVYVTVTGERSFDFVWGGTEGGDAYTHSVQEGNHLFGYSFQNNGNTSVDLTADLELKNFFFFKMDAVNVDMGTLMAGTSSTPTISFADPPKIGFVTAKTTLTYGPSLQFAQMTEEEIAKYSGSESNTISFFIIPVKEMLATVGVFVLSFAFFFWQHRKIVALIAKCKTVMVKKDESLLTFAPRNKADWKILAKINKIKSPYVITKGSKILVPPFQK